MSSPESRYSGQQQYRTGSRGMRANIQTHSRVSAVLVGVSFALVIGATPLALAAEPDTGQVDPQFRSIADYYRGRWNCSGHFANGKPILSDEQFESSLAGTWLRQSHHDHPPYSYRAQSDWGIDKQSHSLTLTIRDNFGGLRLFVSHDWNGPSITFEAYPILGHSGSTERFVYTTHPPAAFSFEYQVLSADGTWSLGDHVDCAKIPAQGPSKAAKRPTKTPSPH
jgi:hypothetical protein